MKKIGVEGFACSNCGELLHKDDVVEACSDCGAIFCEECVKEGALKSHECDE